MIEQKKEGYLHRYIEKQVGEFRIGRLANEGRPQNYKRPASLEHILALSFDEDRHKVRPEYRAGDQKMVPLV